MKIKMFLRNTRLLAYCACISMIMSLSACAGADEEIFAFEAVEVKMLSGWFSTDGGDISVDWGDGSVSKFSGKEKRYSKKYESKGNRKVTLIAANQGVLTEFRMDQSGENIRFDLAGLPRGLTYLHCGGLNSVTGDVASLPPGLTYYYCEGNNTVKGKISDLPRTLTLFSTHGRNTINGDFSELPPNLTSLRIAGRSTVGGDLANLPRSLTSFLSVSHSKVTGDLANLPKDLIFFYCGGTNNISEYTAGRTWSPKMTCVHLQPAVGHGLDTKEVDSLLADLAKTTWAGEKKVWLAGNNAPRSGASDEAVSLLEKAGVTVSCNTAKAGEETPVPAAGH